MSRRGFKDFSRTMSGLTRTLSGGASSQNRTGPAPVPVNGESALSSANVVFGTFGIVVQLNRFGLNTRGPVYFVAFSFCEQRFLRLLRGPFSSFDKLSLCKLVILAVISWSKYSKA